MIEGDADIDPAASHPQAALHRLLERHFVLDPADSLARMEDGQDAPVWLLSAERDAESARSTRDLASPQDLVGRR